ARSVRRRRPRSAARRRRGTVRERSRLRFSLRAAEIDSGAERRRRPRDQRVSAVTKEPETPESLAWGELQRRGSIPAGYLRNLERGGARARGGRPPPDA